MKKITLAKIVYFFKDSLPHIIYRPYILGGVNAIPTSQICVSTMLSRNVKVQC